MASSKKEESYKKFIENNMYIPAKIDCFINYTVQINNSGVDSRCKNTRKVYHLTLHIRTGKVSSICPLDNRAAQCVIERLLIIVHDG